jgi:hypothetical protein
MRKNGTRSGTRPPAAESKVQKASSCFVFFVLRRFMHGISMAPYRRAGAIKKKKKN